MKTKAVRLYGKNDFRLEEFELGEIKDDEILAQVISDSICMSSYKAAIQGEDHKRVPKDIASNPVIVGHEFCGKILKVGAKWRSKFTESERFVIQPALNMESEPFKTPGYSYGKIGGDATYIIIPNEVMELNCLLNYEGDTFFYGSLAEPMSCIIGAFHACYHTTMGSYTHNMGIVKGGNMAILAGVGPMGLGAIDYALHCQRRPKRLVVTDINAARIERARQIYTVEEAQKNGVELIYVNTSEIEDVERYLISLTDGKGFDDVFVMAPVKAVVEQGDCILAKDGCLNFFAGPSQKDFKAQFNFYNVHYNSTHLVGTSGGNTNDMIESIDMMTKGLINPAAMITHIGGLNSVAETTLNLPYIAGGKKLVYTNIDMKMTAIDDFDKMDDPLFAALADITKNNNGLWSKEAEIYLLEHAKKI